MEKDALTPVVLAWAAGLFEGEGSVRINKATRQNLSHLTASVTNTDQQVIAFFQDRWPGHCKRVKTMRPDQKPAWAWLVAARRATHFLNDIGPYIRTDRVKDKARFGIAFQDGKRRDWENRTDQYREDQFNAYLWMKELNVRGTGIAWVSDRRGR